MGAVVGMGLVVTRPRTSGRSPTSRCWSPATTTAQNDNNSTYDRDYQYVPNGVTEQVGDGYEDSGWVAAAPAGEGWVQIDQQTVNGNEIPCDDFETKKVTLCHATSSETTPRKMSTVSVSRVHQHQSHRPPLGDIYEAFSYVKHGQTHNVAANGDIVAAAVRRLRAPQARSAGRSTPEVTEVYTDSAAGDGQVTGTRTTTRFKAVFNASSIGHRSRCETASPLVVQISRPLNDRGTRTKCRPPENPPLALRDRGHRPARVR